WGGGPPRRGRSGPDPRRPAGEHDVAGEHHAGNVGDHVTGGVRRPDLLQDDGAIADRDLERPAERLVRRGGLDVVEPKGTERLLDEAVTLLAQVEPLQRMQQ